MACNTCAKPFNLLRKEKGCPGCGFSYCSKCLDHKMFLEKLNAEAKVCVQCKKKSNYDKKIEPPSAYFKRLATVQPPDPNDSNTNYAGASSKDNEILKRLQNLKQEQVHKKVSTDDEIAQRLKNIKGDLPSASVSEIEARLANLRGVPVQSHSKPILPTPDLRTEQEQADDLMKQYLEQVNIDTKYKDDFNDIIDSIESRVQKLKSSSTEISEDKSKLLSNNNTELDEEETVNKIIEKIKADPSLDETVDSPTKNDELPFCEICNEDAVLRCLGCRYLFCKLCFMEHKDDDDGCDRYENYQPPTN